jgi:hypothetical protein
LAEETGGAYKNIDEVIEAPEAGGLCKPVVRFCPIGNGQRLNLHMQPHTPITIITGPLGSRKTTLLRHLLDSTPRRLAIVMNEFGEVGIDTKIIEGRNIRIAELAGGCVCCSLIGEFEAAVNELLDRVHPEHIVVEPRVSQSRGH